MKTNRELNTEYDIRQQARRRPKQAVYDFGPLGEAMQRWVIGEEATKAREVYSPFVSVNS